MDNKPNMAGDNRGYRRNIRKIRIQFRISVGGGGLGLFIQEVKKVKKKSRARGEHIRKEVMELERIRDGPKSIEAGVQN